jgi:hypothetical protein
MICQEPLEPGLRDDSSPGPKHLRGLKSLYSISCTAVLSQWLVNDDLCQWSQVLRRFSCGDSFATVCALWRWESVKQCGWSAVDAEFEDYVAVIMYEIGLAVCEWVDSDLLRGMSLQGFATSGSCAIVFLWREALIAAVISANVNAWGKPSITSLRSCKMHCFFGRMLILLIDLPFREWLRGLLVELDRQRAVPGRRSILKLYQISLPALMKWNWSPEAGFGLLLLSCAGMAKTVRERGA